MSIKLDVLESRYRQHGVTYEAAALLGDAKAMNKIFAKWIAIGPKLRGLARTASRSCGASWAIRLTPLLPGLRLTAFPSRKRRHSKYWTL